jgi:hypothetical protein
MGSRESRRGAFRAIVKGMTTAQLKRLSEVLCRSTDEVVEELVVLQEQIAAHSASIRARQQRLRGSNGRAR